jgi:hypothetical protein
MRSLSLHLGENVRSKVGKVPEAGWRSWTDVGFRERLESGRIAFS